MSEAVKPISVSNTQEMLNILTGSLLEHEQCEEPDLTRDEEHNSDEGLTDDGWNHHVLLEELLEEASQPTRMSSRTQLSAQAQKLWIRPVLVNMWKRKQKQIMKSDTCKNRNDIAGQSIDLEWHECPADTSVQILHELQVVMSETGHEPESFPDRNVQRHHQLR